MPEDSVATRSYPPAEPNDAAVVREMQAGDDRRFRPSPPLRPPALRDVLRHSPRPERAEEFTQQTWYVFTVQLQHVTGAGLGCWLQESRGGCWPAETTEAGAHGRLPDDESPLPPSCAWTGRQRSWHGRAPG